MNDTPTSSARESAREAAQSRIAVVNEELTRLRGFVAALGEGETDKDLEHEIAIRVTELEGLGSTVTTLDSEIAAERADVVRQAKIARSKTRGELIAVTADKPGRRAEAVRRASSARDLAAAAKSALAQNDDQLRTLLQTALAGGTLRDKMLAAWQRKLNEAWENMRAAIAEVRWVDDAGTEQSFDLADFARIRDEEGSPEQRLERLGALRAELRARMENEAWPVLRDAVHRAPIERGDGVERTKQLLESTIDDAFYLASVPGAENMKVWEAQETVAQRKQNLQTLLRVEKGSDPEATLAFTLRFLEDGSPADLLAASGNFELARRLHAYEQGELKEGEDELEKLLWRLADGLANAKRSDEHSSRGEVDVAGAKLTTINTNALQIAMSLGDDLYIVWKGVRAMNGGKPLRPDAAGRNEFEHEISVMALNLYPTGGQTDIPEHALRDSMPDAAERTAYLAARKRLIEAVSTRMRYNSVLTPQLGRTNAESAVRQRDSELEYLGRVENENMTALKQLVAHLHTRETVEAEEARFESGRPGRIAAIDEAQRAFGVRVEQVKTANIEQRRKRQEAHEAMRDAGQEIINLCGDAVLGRASIKAQEARERLWSAMNLLRGSAEYSPSSMSAARDASAALGPLIAPIQTSRFGDWAIKKAQSKLPELIETLGGVAANYLEILADQPLPAKPSPSYDEQRLAAAKETGPLAAFEAEREKLARAVRSSKVQEVQALIDGLANLHTAPAGIEEQLRATNAALTADLERRKKLNARLHDPSTDAPDLSVRREAAEQAVLDAAA